MKITNEQLRQIIKEELETVLDEGFLDSVKDFGKKAFDFTTEPVRNLGANVKAAAEEPYLNDHPLVLAFVETLPDNNPLKKRMLNIKFAVDPTMAKPQSPEIKFINEVRGMEEFKQFKDDPKAIEAGKKLVRKRERARNFEKYGY
jgi:hypothetical protein